jgi:beta-lactamase class A
MQAIVRLVGLTFPLVVLTGGCATSPRTEAGAGIDVRDPASAAAMAGLEARLRALMTDLPGEAGLYLRHLASGATVAISAEDTFPTASMIKLPLLVTLFDEVRERPAAPGGAAYTARLQRGADG